MGRFAEHICYLLAIRTDNDVCPDAWAENLCFCRDPESAASRPHISEEKAQHAGLAAHDAGPQLLAVLHHEQAVVGQAADDAVGAVDDQTAGSVASDCLRKAPLGWASKSSVLQRRDDVLVGLDAQAQLRKV